jgi:hypothetical protein
MLLVIISFSLGGQSCSKEEQFQLSYKGRAASNQRKGGAKSGSVCMVPVYGPHSIRLGEDKIRVFKVFLTMIRNLRFTLCAMESKCKLPSWRLK